MELAVQTLAVACAFLIVAVIYLTSLVRSANAALKDVAIDAITASRATSATEFASARSMNKMTDTPLKDLPQSPPQAPRVYADPKTGAVLERLRPR